MWGASRNEHQLQIVEEAVKLSKKGFTVYLEHAIHLSASKQKRVIVDIYAKKGTKEIVVEVGTLSDRWAEGRLQFLKNLLPKAKIVHITQWKNWICQSEWQELNFTEYLKRSHIKYPVR